MFEKRTTELERIDTGDYTPEEYETFLREIAFINRYVGDKRALEKSLLREIESTDLREFSVLDVGCGSGELLRVIAEFASRTGRNAHLTGIDLNPISSSVTKSESRDFPEIESVRGNALELPFADHSFDYSISSLFFHHLKDDEIVDVLREMSRVSRRGIFIIDLHRDVVPFIGYKIFCFVFRISELVRHDGSLSIRKAFRERELVHLANEAGLSGSSTKIVSPGRVVLTKYLTDRSVLP